TAEIDERWRVGCRVMRATLVLALVCLGGTAAADGPAETDDAYPRGEGAVHAGLAVLGRNIFDEFGTHAPGPWVGGEVAFRPHKFFSLGVFGAFAYGQWDDTTYTPSGSVPYTVGEVALDLGIRFNIHLDNFVSGFGFGSGEDHFDEPGYVMYEPHGW